MIAVLALPRAEGLRASRPACAPYGPEGSPGGTAERGRGTRGDVDHQLAEVAKSRGAWGVWASRASSPSRGSDFKTDAQPGARILTGSVTDSGVERKSRWGFEPRDETLSSKGRQGTVRSRLCGASLQKPYEVLALALRTEFDMSQRRGANLLRHFQNTPFPGTLAADGFC